MSMEQATLKWLNEYLTQGILVVDKNLVILNWNQWLAAHSNRSASSMIGRPLSEAIPDLAERRLDIFFQQALDGQVVLMSQRFHRYLIPLIPDDERLGLPYMPQTARISPLLEDGQVIGAIALIEDVTDRVRQEKELGRRIATQEAMHEIDLAILTLDMAASLDRVVHQAANLTKATLSAVVLQDEHGTLEIAAHNLTNAQETPPAFTLEGSIAAWVVQNGLPLSMANLKIQDAQSPALHPLVSTHHSALVMPLQVEERILGALVMESQDVNAFSEQAHSFAHALATQAAIAIRNAWLYREVQNYAQNLEALVTARTTALAAVNEELQLALAYKSEFVVNASHELRTPLTNIRLMLYLLDRLNSGPDDDEKTKQYLATLDRESALLQHMLEELFYLSQMDLNRPQFEAKAVNIAQILADLIKDRQEMITQRDLRLITHIPAGLPTARGDGLMIAQMFSNLLNNAIHYNRPKGEISITAGQANGEDGRRWLCVDFADTGYGIEENETERVFERFYRGTASVLTGAPGAGLGLAIGKEIADRHDGRITLVSEPGQSSTFTVWLPLMDP